MNNHGTGAVSGAEVTITADSFFFQPTCLTSSGGETITVTVKNVSTALHNLTVEDVGIDQDVQAGETVSVQVELPSSGVLPFNCKYHVSAGMVGAFLVS